MNLDPIIMIKNVLLGAMLLLSLPSLAQTVVSFREAPLMGSGQYFLNGTAIIEELDNGSFQFRLSSDYSTNSGPDVQIYLTNNSNFSTPVDLNGTLFVEDIGNEPGPNQPGISHFSGALTKELPTLTSLSDFDHVVFVCFRFGQLHWGNGSFGNLLTDIEEGDLTEQFSIYPNPTRGAATLDLGDAIDLNAEDLNIEVFNTQGTQVYAMENPRGSKVLLDLEKYDAGLYFIRIRHTYGQQILQLLKQ